MSDAAPDPGSSDPIAGAAAGWVLRVDRGLSPAEQDAFSAWLAADPRHGAELARYRRHWRRLDQLATWLPEHGERPNPDLLAPAPRPRFPRWPLATVGLAAAALVVGIALHTLIPEPAAVASLPKPASGGPRVLADGTRVELNRVAAITVHFSPAERRVRLEHGEAHFAVTKDAARPFVVEGAGIRVLAVGTAFNVRVDAAAVEVLVTEGRVALHAPVVAVAALPAAPAFDSLLVPSLEARQRAVISLAPQPEAPQVATLTPGEIERVLAWQHRLLDFTNAPLPEIVAAFNQRNALQLLVLDPQLAAIRLSAALRSDNLEGFVHLLERGFDVRAERRGDTEIVLRRSIP